MRSRSGREEEAKPVKIRILGCHGSDQLIVGAPARECRACAFLINDSLLIDAGTVGSVLDLEGQRRLRHVLVSHLHFDHIQGLPTLADSLFDHDGGPLRLVSTPEILKGLQAHVFNDEIYPDFTQLPSPERPVFRPSPLEPCRPMTCGDLQVTAVPVNHQVPTVGFIVDDGRSAIVYSGDTYETEQIWNIAGRLPRLKAAFIEASFPEAMSGVAQVSKHLTPSLFHREFAKLARPDVRVYAFHLKPRFRDRVVRELKALPIADLVVLEEGQEIIV